jgi:hypothetical protein
MASAAAAVTAAIVVACAVLAMIHTSGGFSRPLQATPTQLAASAHPPGQG